MRVFCFAFWSVAKTRRISLYLKHESNLLILWYFSCVRSNQPNNEIEMEGKKSQIKIQKMLEHARTSSLLFMLPFWCLLHLYPLKANSGLPIKHSILIVSMSLNGGLLMEKRSALHGLLFFVCADCIFHRKREKEYELNRYYQKPQID